MMLVLLNKYSIQTLSFFIIPYSFIGITFYILLMIRKNRKLSQKSSYALTILLYQVYDQISMLLISYSFWAIGLRLLDSSLNVMGYSAQVITPVLKVLLVIMVALSIIYSRKQIQQKVESILAEKVIVVLPDWLLKLFFAIPIAGVIMGSIVFRGNNQAFVFTLLSFLSLLFGFLVIPIVTVAFCETIILATNKWPVIKKVGSEYVVGDD